MNVYVKDFIAKPSLDGYVEFTANIDCDSHVLIEHLKEYYIQNAFYIEIVEDEKLNSLTAAAIKATGEGFKMYFKYRFVNTYVTLKVIEFEEGGIAKVRITNFSETF